MFCLSIPIPIPIPTPDLGCRKTALYAIFSWPHFWLYFTWDLLILLGALAMVTNLMKTLSSPPSSEAKGGAVRRVERRKATGVVEWLFICGAKSKNSTTSSARVAHSHSSFRCARRRRVFLHKFRTIADGPYKSQKIKCAKSMNSVNWTHCIWVRRVQFNCNSLNILFITCSIESINWATTMVRAGFAK